MTAVSGGRWRWAAGWRQPGMTIEGGECRWRQVAMTAHENGCS
jgi:hypothetical protein